MVNNTKITSGQLKKFCTLNRVNKTKCEGLKFKRPRKKTKVNSLIYLLGGCSVKNRSQKLPKTNGSQTNLHRIICNMEKQAKQNLKNKTNRKNEIERQKRLANNRRMKELIKSLKLM